MKQQSFIHHFMFPTILTLGLFLLFTTSAQAVQESCPPLCGNSLQSPDDNTFYRRTYQNKQNRKHVESVIHRKKVQKNQRPQLRNNNNQPPVIVTRPDFVNHLEEGQNRHIQYVTTDIMMDVKGLQDEEIWDMPDFNNFNLDVLNLSQLSVTDAGLDDIFPLATHAVYYPNDDTYEVFELLDDELVLSGYTFHDGPDTYAVDDFISMCPLPVDAGDIFEAAVLYIYEDGFGLDSTLFEQSFDIVSYGTLNTYDDGPIPALKIYYEELETDYVADVIVDQYVSYEIWWYTTTGHILKGYLDPEEIGDFYPEDDVTFYSMEYQKITGTLPVEWSNFHAKLNEQQEVVLAWRTIAERNNSHFLVERSSDGEQFYSIGKVEAGGTTTGLKDYHFTDTSPEVGTNYYRIQQVDANGKTSTSSVVSVLLSAGSDDAPVIVLYPNPGKDEVFFSEAAAYELFDAQGRLLTTGTANGALDVSEFDAGVYFVKINGGEMVQWVKQ